MNIFNIYFSPTGGTKKIATTLAQSISDYLGPQVSEVVEADITLASARLQDDSTRESRIISVEKDDLAILAFPTYAGKLPNKILPDIKAIIHGNGGPCICVTTFGNRSFDNSLAELTHLAIEANFKPIGAASFVCEHPFSEKLGTNRPNLMDIVELSKFAKEISDVLVSSPEDEVLEALGLKSAKDTLSDTTSNFASDILSSIPGYHDAPYYTPKKADGTPANFLKAKVITNPDLCDNCGLCVKHCPISSISKENPAEIAGPCIKCHACVKICPRNAKYFDDTEFLSHVEYLENHHQNPKKNFWVTKQ